MARHVFFSFHYAKDIFRVNQIRNLPEIVDEAAAGFRDKSLWEESKTKGDAVIKRLIDKALAGTSVSVICIGSATAGRKYINYEIEQSILRGNGMLGVRIHHLDAPNEKGGPQGAVPALLTKHAVPVYNYSSHASLKSWIEAAAKAAGK
jgi:hypothetical protein